MTDWVGARVEAESIFLRLYQGHFNQSIVLKTKTVQLLDFKSVLIETKGSRSWPTLLF